MVLLEVLNLLQADRMALAGSRGWSSLSPSPDGAEKDDLFAWKGYFKASLCFGMTLLTHIETVRSWIFRSPESSPSSQVDRQSPLLIAAW